MFEEDVPGDIKQVYLFFTGEPVQALGGGGVGGFVKGAGGFAGDDGVSRFAERIGGHHMFGGGGIGGRLGPSHKGNQGKGSQ